MADDDADLDNDKDAAPEDDPEVAAYKSFMAGDFGSVLRYVDSPENREKLSAFLDQYDPPLPTTPESLLFGYSELVKRDELELEPLADELPEEEVEEALRDHEESRAKRERDEPEDKPQSEPATISQAAKQMATIFRKRGEAVRYRNGKRIDSGFGS